MATLFEIGNQLVSVLHQINDDGEIGPELEEFFNDLQNQEAVKLTNYLNLIATIEMEAAAARAQAEQFSMKAKTRENKIKSLKDRMNVYLEMTGRTRATASNTKSVRIQANGGTQALKITLEAVPQDYKVERVVVDIDEQRIRSELMKGETLEFATLEPRGTHLRIG